MKKMNSTIEKMFKLAREAQENAYAPYSNFSVGACIKTTSGEYFSGANVENVSYALTVCAEQAACSTMVSSGCRHIAEILIIGGAEDICPPCGACRQLLYEFSQEDTLIYLCNDKGLQASVNLVDLLPSAFSSKHMEVCTSTET